MSPFAGAAIRLLLLTGCRLREILHLRWSDVDLERGMLNLLNSKTGRKNVILNAPALAVIGTLPRMGDYLIHGERPDKPRADLKRPWAIVCRRAGLEGVRIHDLRHSFASIGVGTGHGLPIVGKLLGHADASSTARYAVRPPERDDRSRPSVRRRPSNLRGCLSSRGGPLRLLVSTALTGPLLDLVGYDGGGIHVCGASSIGKTTALRLAASPSGRGSSAKKAWNWWCWMPSPSIRSPRRSPRGPRSLW